MKFKLKIAGQDTIIGNADKIHIIDGNNMYIISVNESSIRTHEDISNKILNILPNPLRTIGWKNQENN